MAEINPFALLPVAGALHVVEEYLYPGGFPGMMKQMNPRFARFITPVFAIAINGAFLLICLAAAWLGERSPVFGLSAMGIALFNALTHSGASLRLRHYTPGLFTGLVVYLPLALFAFHRYIANGWLLPSRLAVSLLLGLIFQLVPVVYLTGASWVDIQTRKDRS